MHRRSILAVAACLAVAMLAAPVQAKGVARHAARRAVKTAKQRAATHRARPRKGPQRHARMSLIKSHDELSPTLAREPFVEPREVADPNDPHEQRIALLRERLVNVLRDSPLRRTHVGVEVMQASDGQVLFAHNADVLFNPASNTKILTTAAALSYLGGDYRYHTALYGPAPDSAGVVHGDVVLRGSGDPSLTPSDLAELARNVAAHGIVRIEGNLFGDSKFHGSKETAPQSGGVGQGALILNRNTYAVHVYPGSVGHSGSIRVEPRGAVYAIENQTTTVRSRRSRLRVDTYRKDDRLILTVRGRISVRRGEYVDVRRLADGAYFAAATLKSALSDFGVTLTGEAQAGAPADPPAGLLAEHLSPPLAQVCALSNKPSNNFIAEAIYRTLGGELYGLPGNLAKGTRAVMDFLTAAGIQPATYKIVNGSGLTHENRITARDVASLLRKIYYDVSLGPDFIDSLAIGGIDGTIRNRFAGTGEVGLVRAKTGTLDSVSALSGYLGDKGDILVFSIFVHGFRQRHVNQVRHAQVRLVEAMMSYLRADERSPAVGEPGRGIDATPPEDNESDGDPAPLTSSTN